MTRPDELFETLGEEMGRVLVGNEDVVEGLTVALLTRGHVLLEGVPGVAKTTIANLLARASGLEYARIQLTPDLLPADITGTHVYREARGEFELQKGPVFANLIVADEINRATPKTQSALLEAMQERRATIEGETFGLPIPFMVVATQNPLEFEGVYELPEAQRDRFMLKLTVDLPGRDDERELLDRFDADPELGPEEIDRVLSVAEVMSAREAVAAVHVADPVKEYVLDVVAATREHPELAFGGSPRATLALLSGGKATAAIDGRDYVIPDDVKGLVVPALEHRVVLTPEAELGERGPREILEGITDSVAPPGSVDAAPAGSAVRPDGDGAASDESGTDDTPGDEGERSADDGST